MTEISVGEVDVAPPPPKTIASEIIPPQPKAINYQDQHDKCKACGLVGTGDLPLMVIKQITATGEGTFVAEHYVHTGCIGVLVITRPRSLFQIKLKNED